MTPETIAWIVLAAAAVTLETIALIRKDTPTQPRTLTANIRWLITGAGWGHWVARGVLIGLLAWLPGHLLGGGN